MPPPVGPEQNPWWDQELKLQKLFNFIALAMKWKRAGNMETKKSDKKVIQNIFAKLMTMIITN